MTQLAMMVSILFICNCRNLVWACKDTEFIYISVLSGFVVCLSKGMWQFVDVLCFVNKISCVFVCGRMAGRVIIAGLAVVKTLNYDTFRGGLPSFMRLFVRFVATGYPLGSI